MSVGRDGRWQRPLAGALDELRISDAARYGDDFAPPESFSRHPADPPSLPDATPLRFPDGRPRLPNAGSC